jgi:hypothetical protein
MSSEPQVKADVSKVGQSNFNELVDELENEFNLYQVCDFPDSVVKCADMDVQWHLISKMKNAEGVLKFASLAKVMQGILTIPHSNAECERIFSIVRKNKTDFRPNLSLASLEALLVQRVNGSATSCFETKYTRDFLKKAQHATNEKLSG